MGAAFQPVTVLATHGDDALGQGLGNLAQQGGRGTDKKIKMKNTVGGLVGGGLFRHRGRQRHPFPVQPVHLPVSGDQGPSFLHTLIPFPLKSVCSCEIQAVLPCS